MAKSFSAASTKITAENKVIFAGHDKPQKIDFIFGSYLLQEIDRYH
jgi:hypothetical protein